MPRKMIEDPSIARVAHMEAERIANRIEAAYALGEPFFHVREKLLMEEAPVMAKAYGPEVSKRAVQAVLTLGAHDMSKWARACHRRALLEWACGPNPSRLNRFWFWLTGMPWSADHLKG